MMFFFRMNRGVPTMTTVLQYCCGGIQSYYYTVNICIYKSFLFFPLPVPPFFSLLLLCSVPPTKALQGPFTDVLEGTVKKDSFLYKWLDYLSFALR